MTTFDDALQSLCAAPNSPNDSPERAAFLNSQTEFQSDVTANPLCALMADMTVGTIIKLLVGNGLPPDLMPVGREAYLNGLIPGVSIGVRMERREL